MERPPVTLLWTVDPLIGGIYPQSASIGMQYLARYLTTAGFPVQVVDCDLSLARAELTTLREATLERILALVEQTAPALLGVGAYSGSMPVARELIDRFKARHPAVPVVLGGSNATLLPEATLAALPAVDYLVRGEGEVTFLELCEALAAGRTGAGLAGVSWRAGDAIVHGPARTLLPDLGVLPLVDLDEFIHITQDHSLPLVFDRGCVHRCAFCAAAGMWGGARLFPPARVVEQVAHYLRRHPGVRHCYSSDNLFSDLTWVRQLADEFARRLPDYRWAGCATLEPMNEELLRYLKDRGLFGLFVGVESIIPETLRWYGKTSDPDRYLRRLFDLLRWAEQLELTTELAFIIGAPHETQQDILKVIGFAAYVNANFRHLRANIQPLCLFPGTRLWARYARGELAVERIPDAALGPELPEVMLRHPYGPDWFPAAYALRSSQLSLPELLELRTFAALQAGFYKEKQVGGTP